MRMQRYLPFLAFFFLIVLIVPAAQSQVVDVGNVRTLTDHHVVQITANGKSLTVWMPHCGTGVADFKTRVLHCRSDSETIVVTEDNLYALSGHLMADLFAGTVSPEDQAVLDAMNSDPDVQDACESLQAQSDISRIGDVVAFGGLMGCAETLGTGCAVALLGVAVSYWGNELTDDAMDELECCALFAIGCDTADFFDNAPIDCPPNTHPHVGSWDCFCNSTDVPLAVAPCDPDGGACAVYCILDEPSSAECWCDNKGCELCGP